LSRSVERFSSRVENYTKYRPGYPHEIVGLLQDQCGLTKETVVADVGSGTGKLTEILLPNCNEVFAVEPNDQMRAAGERQLKGFPGFKSVAGRAEATTLSSASVDLITAGQAFHWFEPLGARQEFSRILKPLGWVALVWNGRLLQTTPFLKDYEALLLRFGTDYEKVRHENSESAITEFFSPSSFAVATFPNHQVFDYEGLKGRVFSSSYTPEPGNPNFEPMVHQLEQIFDKHQQQGQVVFDYDTRVYYGQL